MYGVRGHDEAGFRTRSPYVMVSCRGQAAVLLSLCVIVMCNEGLSGDPAQWKQPQQGFNIVQIGN